MRCAAWCGCASHSNPLLRDQPSARTRRRERAWLHDTALDSHAVAAACSAGTGPAQPSAQRRPRIEAIRRPPAPSPGARPRATTSAQGVTGHACIRRKQPRVNVRRPATRLCPMPLRGFVMRENGIGHTESGAGAQAMRALERASATRSWRNRSAGCRRQCTAAVRCCRVCP